MNIAAPWFPPKEAEARVLHVQTKLHQWTSSDEAKVLHDLFNLVYLRTESTQPGEMEGLTAALSQQGCRSRRQPVLETQGGWKAASTTPRRARTARWSGFGKQDGKV